MSRYIKENMDLIITEAHLWTDSLITLCWIRKDAATWKTFVRNRVQEIRSLTTSDQWHYCPGSDNPADLLTRGIGARSLLQSTSWWEGPTWISSSHRWPLEPMSLSVQPQQITEQAKPQTMTLQISISNPVDIARFSSLLRLHRVVAWVNRYVHNLRNEEKITGPLTTDEIRKAEDYCIRTTQGSVFRNEISCVSCLCRTLHSSPSVCSLTSTVFCVLKAG